MNEEQAAAVAEALDGQTWQSGGGIWLVIFERKDGKFVALSDDSVCEYKSREKLESAEPEACIVLH